MRILEYISGSTSNVSPFQGPTINSVSLVNGIVAVNREDGQGGYILELNSFLEFTGSILFIVPNAGQGMMCPSHWTINPGNQLF